MAHKGGRPISENPREKLLSVRVTEDEQEKLKEYAENNNLTLTQAVLKAINMMYVAEGVQS